MRRYAAHTTRSKVATFKNSFPKQISPRQKLSALLSLMTDEQLLAWSRAPRPIERFNVARVLLNELNRRGIA